jgi:outer membrane protein OmpA-like peptidoglycan-associated protein
MQTHIAQTLFAYLSILLCGLVVGGCAAGHGAGVGFASYIKGDVTRTYESDHYACVRASMESLRSLKISVTETTDDEMKTTLYAQRTDGTPVTVTITRTTRAQTSVGVRTGSLRLSDLQISQKVQNRIAERLSAQSIEEHQGPSVVPQAVEKPDPIKKTFAEKYPPELTIYFETDSNALLQNEIVKLDAIAERLTRHPALKLTLNGYSDASGSKHYNRMISESRAMSVKMYLMGKGIDHLRIAIVGHGAIKFVSGNTREEDRRLNRRVEIDIVKTDSKSSMGVRDSF